MKRNTLDLDNCGAGRFLQVYRKVSACRGLFSLKVGRSASLNGYHFTMWCRRGCEDCRLVFDDAVRFMLDKHYRSVAEQNVLFQRKTFKKAGQHIILKVDV